MGCRRMLGVEDRAAIMAGLEAGLSQVCIAHLIGRSPSLRRADGQLHRSLPGHARISRPDSHNLHPKPTVGFTLVSSSTPNKTAH